MRRVWRSPVHAEDKICQLQNGLGRRKRFSAHQKPDLSADKSHGLLHLAYSNIGADRWKRPRRGGVLPCEFVNVPNREEDEEIRSKMCGQREGYSSVDDRKSGLFVSCPAVSYTCFCKALWQ